MAYLKNIFRNAAARNTPCIIMLRELDTLCDYGMPLSHVLSNLFRVFDEYTDLPILLIVTSDNSSMIFHPFIVHFAEDMMIKILPLNGEQRIALLKDLMKLGELTKEDHELLQILRDCTEDFSYAALRNLVTIAFEPQLRKDLSSCRKLTKKDFAHAFRRLSDSHKAFDNRLLYEYTQASAKKLSNAQNASVGCCQFLQNIFSCVKQKIS